MIDGDLQEFYRDVLIYGWIPSQTTVDMATRQFQKLVKRVRVDGLIYRLYVNALVHRRDVSNYHINGL